MEEGNKFSGFSVQEESDYSRGIPSLKEIVLLHIRKLSEICCQEFTKGYWEEKPIKVGSGMAIMRVYHSDQRAVFCNAVDFLVWLVYPTADESFKNKIVFETPKDKKEETDFILVNDEETDLDKKLKIRKEVFREINIMFERTNFFDGQSGRKE